MENNFSEISHMQKRMRGNAKVSTDCEATFRLKSLAKLQSITALRTSQSIYSISTVYKGSSYLTLVMTILEYNYANMAAV